MFAVQFQVDLKQKGYFNLEWIKNAKTKENKKNLFQNMYGFFVDNLRPHTAH